MKQKYFRIAEIIIWFGILLGSLYYFIVETQMKDISQNMYYLFVDDAGGLVKGSPVRLMGINIGYIQDVKIFDNKVFVSFHLTKNDTALPKKTAAIIEFYGLGGSTSLELMPDNSITEEDRDAILLVNSYRVKDLWDGQALVAHVMIDIYGGIGRTIQSAGLINKKELLKQSEAFKNFAKQAGIVNTAQTVIIEKLSENTKDYLKKINAQNNIQEQNNENSKKEI